MSIDDLLLTQDINLVKNPLPIQYLGSKTRISKWILGNLENKFPHANKLIDLFSGSGSVAFESLRRGICPTVNDIQPYSAALLKALFMRDRGALDEIIEYLKSPEISKRLLSNGREDYAEYLAVESIYIAEYTKNNKLNWKNYKNFVEKTQIITDNKEVIQLRKKAKWNLICKYYTNTYFGVLQSMHVDLIREIANDLPSNLKIQLIGTLISSLTHSVSSTTHLAQYLKISSEKTAIHLLKKRAINVLEDVIARLESLKRFKVYEDVNVYNDDFLKALERMVVEVNMDRSVVYADPPYFKEHYSRYYHLLDTVYYYDFPEMTFNPRIGSLTNGRYRENRIVSSLGLKSKVRDSFKDLFKKCQDYDLPLIVSYADTSLVNQDEIIHIAECAGYNVEVSKTALMHSGQGQKRNKTVNELLFICK